MSAGDTLHFLGHTTDFESTVHSMQIEHKSVTEAKKGDSVGVKVSEKVREGDKVYKIVADLFASACTLSGKAIPFFAFTQGIIKIHFCA